MNQTDTARRRLADLPLRLKLFVGLGVSIVGLLIIAGVTSYTNVVNQQLVSRTLTHQHQLASAASVINNDLLTIQHQATKFHDDWSTTGFERLDQGGFERAQRVYIIPLQEQIEHVRDSIAEIERLEPDEPTRADLAQIMRSVNAYETTLLQVSDHMEGLGFANTGDVGEMRVAMTELHSQLNEVGLEMFEITLLQISEYEKEYLLHSSLTSAMLTQNLIRQLKEQIAATDDDQLAPKDKAQLIATLDYYYDHFLSAANHLTLLGQSRDMLISQSDLISTLVGNLFEQQQVEFKATVEQLQRRQSNITFTMIGLAVLIFFASISTVYVVAGRIIRPVQILGEAADRLGAGELDVRATILGRDEIGTTAAAFNLMADRLQETLAGLEQRVADRTRELEQRSAYLEASAEIGRAASSTLDADQLIQQVVELIRERFDLYYVGLFLTDQASEWAVLQAGTGEAGRAMLARGHRLEIGLEGMIGWSIANAQARIALYAEEDIVRTATAELPDTRSEAALPLRSRGRVLGALTIQHDQPDAFDDNTIAALQTMADQVAVALDNARLFTESQAALEATRRVYSELRREAWGELLRAQPDLGYRSHAGGVTPAGDIWRTDMEQALLEGKTIQSNGSDAEEKLPLAVPIKVRDDVIGVLDTYKLAGAGEWTAEEISLLETLAEQLGEALESARLYQDTQLRAAREQLTREITDKMRAATSVEGIVQAAVDELFSVMKTSRTFVRLGTVTEKQGDAALLTETR